MTQEVKESKRAPQGAFSCDCGAVFDFQGKLNLHKYHCANRRMREAQKEMAEKAAGTKKPAKKEKAAAETCADGVHSFRVLRADRPNEAAAIGKGFDEVCRKCQDLR